MLVVLGYFGIGFIAFLVFNAISAYFEGELDEDAVTQNIVAACVWPVSVTVVVAIGLVALSIKLGKKLGGWK